MQMVFAQQMSERRESCDGVKAESKAAARRSRRSMLTISTDIEMTQRGLFLIEGNSTKLSKRRTR